MRVKSKRDMEKEIKKLSKYGLVKTCKIVNDTVLTIVITDGFSDKETDTLEFIKEITSLFPDFKKISTLITEDNLAIIVLIQ